MQALGRLEQPKRKAKPTFLILLYFFRWENLISTCLLRHPRENGIDIRDGAEVCWALILWLCEKKLTRQSLREHSPGTRLCLMSKAQGNGLKPWCWNLVLSDEFILLPPWVLSLESRSLRGSVRETVEPRARPVLPEAAFCHQEAGGLGSCYSLNQGHLFSVWRGLIWTVESGYKT